MSCKIKSTLNFVKLWFNETRREEVPFTVVSDNQKDADKAISDIIESWVNIEADDSGNQIYQCYLKNIVTSVIHEATVFDKSTADIVISDTEVLKVISDSRLKLIPTDKEWEFNNKPAVFVTHDLITPAGVYQGMTISDLVHKYLNDSYAIESL